MAGNNRRCANPDTQAGRPCEPSGGKISVRGAREHNLRNVDVEIPKGKLVVFTGVSGSGKSSLAVDTIYAEGNRRYVESLSSYARQFLGQMERPRYDTIRGLSPSIAIQQKAPTRNPRSTVGTITEVYDYLRLLYARLGKQRCHLCGLGVTRHSPEQMAREISALPAGTKFLILAPLASGSAEDVERGIKEARLLGLVRVRVDGAVRALDEEFRFVGDGPHRAEAVIDRLIVKDDMSDRLTDSVETALKIGQGAIAVSPEGANDMVFTEHLACHSCGIRFPELTPASFSFNSPHGACPSCTGLGRILKVDPDRVVPDRDMSVSAGAIAPLARGAEGSAGKAFLKSVIAFLKSRKTNGDVPFREIEAATRKSLLDGDGRKKGFEGLVPWLKRRTGRTRSEAMRRFYTGFFSEAPCPDCGGARLKIESRNVLVGGRTIVEAVSMTIAEAQVFFDSLGFPPAESAVAEEILREVRTRLRFLLDVGVGYLTLDRQGASLSGGESQRIRLASQLGSELTGVLYILDEPSIGLHSRDIDRLITTLKNMRDIGNTVLVVEHDPAMIRAADHVIDFGPGAGVKGGRVLFSGPPGDLPSCAESLTGQYMSGARAIQRPAARRKESRGAVTLKGVDHHNLKNIDVRVPLGLFVCVTGVSGAGKSTLVNHVLYPALARSTGKKAAPEPGGFRKIEGAAEIDKVIAVDQRPLGRSARSNPVIYTRAFNHIRDLFAGLRESKMYGYGPARFSFNVKGGRCESCRGDGIKRIEMHFLPDVFVTCEECGGRRFNEATCKVKFRGLSIADVLEMTVDEAMELFANMPLIEGPLSALRDVGLGYVKLGQPSATLSGGESQRIRLARELSRQATGRTLYILDEPTTGLHFDDIRNLLKVLDRLVDAGNTMIVIEHNLEVVKCADYVIDLGPEGGAAGGSIVAEGTPEEVAASPNSHTGKGLAKALAGIS